LIGDDKKCPECGLPLRAPEGYRVNARTIRLFIVLNLLAWIIGCAAAEAWILRDERAFQRECAKGVHPPCVTVDSKSCGRPRTWPNGNTMLFNHSFPF
jgi:hypothetical protein